MATMRKANPMQREAMNATFLWEELRERGYVSLEGGDGCYRSPNKVGDSNFDTFDCYAPTPTLSHAGCTQKASCHGYAILDYTAQWLEIHKDFPRFAYLHF